MAEPTDINKNKSTAGAMVDALRVELKELQSFDTVDPEVLGGKAGKPIPVPKKFTADQIVSFMKQFPKMFPLANENAYFGIARALTVESPDLFDIPSFEEYEKKYGDVMEMQEKGGLASKYIETAKESTPANDPMPASKTTTGSSMAERLTTEKKKQLTLRQLFELEAESKPKGSVPDEVARHISRLEGIVDKVTGMPVLDMIVKDMDVGQVIGDVISEGKFREADLKASPTLRTRSSGLITRLNTMFDNAGFGSGYVKKEVENSLGKDKFNKESGWPFKRQRKIPVGFQSDVYQKLKGILADETLPKEIRNQMAGHLFGGFRPENISQFKIENYDKERGILTFFDKKSDKNKFLVVNPAVQGVLNEQIGDKTSGLIFPNAKANQTKLNRLLTSTMEKVTFAKPDGSIQSENFTVYKLRNLNETILTDSGLSPGDIDFLNGRKPQTEAAGYVAMSARQRRINRAANELVASIAGYSATQSVAQFSADIGISFPENVLQTVVSRDLLVADEYTDALPDEFIDTLESESGTYSKGNIPPADPEQAEQYKKEAIAQSKLREEEALGKAQSKQKARLEEAAKIQELDEDAIRAGEQRRIRKQEIRAEEQAKVKAQTTTDLTNIKSPDDFSDALKEKLRKLNFKPLMKAVPVVGAVPAYMESREAGAGPLEATGRAVLEEATLGIPEALPVAEQAVKAAAEPVAEEIKRQVPEEGFVSGLTRAMTGQGMSGFINR